ncbi:hypothetical protein EYF80_040577 [Liparis tanakae]|uniref:Uncharacterized protein n=1 Tax=Liparis tanakae TaxID=230148 RepID=A0A4Z2G7K8_9TELE|nr:hypothetical protein EYF80_040577 [Liparis tanakae]
MCPSPESSQQRRVNVGDDVRQPPPLADGEAGGHLHQPLDEVELLLLRVADGQVAAVHVHLPRHLLRTAQLHLGKEIRTGGGTFVLMTNQPGERGAAAEERQKGPAID